MTKKINVQFVQLLLTLAEARLIKIHNYDPILCYQGGENWGTQPLSQYSWSNVDLGVESLWCPTTSNHSGKKQGKVLKIATIFILG